MSKIPKFKFLVKLIHFLCCLVLFCVIFSKIFLLQFTKIFSILVFSIRVNISYCQLYYSMLYSMFYIYLYYINFNMYLYHP